MEGLESDSSVLKSKYPSAPGHHKLDDKNTHFLLLN